MGSSVMSASRVPKCLNGVPRSKKDEKNWERNTQVASANECDYREHQSHQKLILDDLGVNVQDISNTLGISMEVSRKSSIIGSDIEKFPPGGCWHCSIPNKNSLDGRSVRAYCNVTRWKEKVFYNEYSQRMRHGYTTTRRSRNTC